MGITIEPGISIRSGINFTNVPNGSIALNLNGTDQTDYVRFQPSAAYNLSSGTFTVEGWFYKTAAGAREMMCANDGASTYYWGIRIQAASNYVAWLGNNAAQANGTVTVITLNAWHHVAAVGNGTSIQLYLDGVSQFATPPTNLFPISAAATGFLDIGRNTNPIYTYNGYINDVRITNGVALYTADFTPPTRTLNVGAGTGFLAQTGYQTPFFESVSNTSGTGVGNAATSTLAPF